ncbi:hypothetical protein X743_02145 [Mesorhizobium sp. LNHC252B00]|nr:hypothetical protein X743_02145 [Mesorhizobium sp. LNHC252B00]
MKKAGFVRPFSCPQASYAVDEADTLLNRKLPLRVTQN